MCTYWNKVSLTKSKSKKNKKIDSIGIGLASPEEIRRWSERRLPNGSLIGRVDKDHTVDYESLKPIEGGLFCERIFGPVEDFCCSCDRRGEKNEKFCPNCNVEFTKSRVRRTRMGYIPLAVPVAHVWYLRGRPSYIANLIGKSRNSVDRLAYGETLCESFIGNTYSAFFQENVKNLVQSKQFEHLTLNKPISLGKLTFTIKGGTKDDKQATILPLLAAFPLGNLPGCNHPNVSLFSCLKKDGTIGVLQKKGQTLGLIKSKESIEKKYKHGRLLYNLFSFTLARKGNLDSIDITSPFFQTFAQATRNGNASFFFELYKRCFQQSFSITKMNGHFSPNVSTLSVFPSFLPLANPFAHPRIHSDTIITTSTYPTDKKAVPAFVSLGNPSTISSSISNFYQLLSSLPASSRAFPTLPLLLPLGNSKGKGASTYPTLVRSGMMVKEGMVEGSLAKEIKISEGYKAEFFEPFSSSLNPRKQGENLALNKIFLALRTEKGVQSKTKFFCQLPYLSSMNPKWKCKAFSFSPLLSTNNSMPLATDPTLLWNSRIRKVGSVAKGKKMIKKSLAIFRMRGYDMMRNFWSNGVVKNKCLQSKAKINGAPSLVRKYNKFHNLPLFSTFIYKEWSHRFSFLEYFIWSSRSDDLALPFYAHQQVGKKSLTSSTKHVLLKGATSLADQTTRKNFLNFVKNSFVLRVENSSGNGTNAFSSTLLPVLWKAQGTKDFIERPLSQRIPSSLQLRNKRCLSILKSHNRADGEAYHFHKLYSKRNAVNEKPKKGLEEERGLASVLRTVEKFFSWGVFQSSDTSVLAIRGLLPLSLARPMPLAKLNFSRTILEKKKIVKSKYTKLNLQNDGIPSSIFVPSSPYPAAKEGVLPVLPFVPLGNPSTTSSSISNFYHHSQHYQLLPLLVRYSCCLKSQAKVRWYGTAGTSGTGMTREGGRRLKWWYGTGETGLPKGTKGSLGGASTMVEDTMSAGNTEVINRKWYDEGMLNKSSKMVDTHEFPTLSELLYFTGGTALRYLLARFDLVLLGKFLRYELKNLEFKVNSLLALKALTYSQGLLLGKLAKRRSKQIRRLKLLELFQFQKSDPEWMILSVLPVLPPDLRPILRVNDDFVVASDLNRLYQTVLRRNNTIRERLDDPLPCPESGLFRQRSLQKAVDGLLENGKGGGTPLCASKRRPLVSLSHVLKGKKGLFRQHLLGKRVDYSGRSVIVVGPGLHLHECGLPKEMAMELFQPFLLHRLKVKGFAASNTAARRMIQQEDPVIWHILKQLVYEHPVLLNRAPTLHRLGIQAFQPRLVSGRAILLHPLVCNGFNADFDGDQMAVHIPLSFQARAEAWKIMWAKNNLLSPATGQPILVPSQDMVLGCYYLSVLVPRVLGYLTPAGKNVLQVQHTRDSRASHTLQPLSPKSYPLFLKKTLLFSENLSSELKPMPFLQFQHCSLPRIASSNRTSYRYREFLGKRWCAIHETVLFLKGVKGKDRTAITGFVMTSYIPYLRTCSTYTSSPHRAGKKQIRLLVRNTCLNQKPVLLGGSQFLFIPLSFSNKTNISTILRFFSSLTKLNILGTFQRKFHSFPMKFFKNRDINKEQNKSDKLTEKLHSCIVKQKRKDVLTRFFDFHCATDPIEGLPKATNSGISYLNQNKEYYFSDLQDSLLAYSQGRLQTHTPCWVRIDSIQNFGASTQSSTTSSSISNFVGTAATSSTGQVVTVKVASKGKVIEVANDDTGSKVKNSSYSSYNPEKSMYSFQPFSSSSVFGDKSFLQSPYGSSQKVCQIIFQNSHLQTIVESNDTLEAPLELRLSVDGNLMKIFPTLQHYYSYNATMIDQCHEKSIKYMRTTPGRVVINRALFSS